MSRDIVLMLVGSLVTVAVASVAIRLATRDARAILHQTGLLLRGLEEAGLVHWSRDADGRVTGLHITLHVKDSAHVTTSGSAALTVERPTDT